MSSKHHKSNQQSNFTKYPNSVDIRPHVVLIYPYVRRDRDAVGLCVAQLSEYLNTKSGMNTHILSIEEVSPTVKRLLQMKSPVQNIIEKAHRAYSQFAFLARAFITMTTFRTTPQLIVITVDAPTGIGLPVQLARWMNPQLQHVAWVMDLYRLAETEHRTKLDQMRALVEANTIAKADRVVTLGECMRERLKRTIDREVDILPIWQDETWITPKPRHYQQAATSSPIDLVYSGTARSGIHPLREMAEAVQSYDDPRRLRLIIRGMGDEVDQLRSYVPATSRCVIFDDLVPAHEVPAKLAAADIHLVTLAESKTGTCVPSKAYAAMAAGRPVLYYGVPDGQAARDILEAGCGFIVEPGSNIQKAIESAAKSDAQLDEMGKSGYSFFIQNRSLDAMGRRWSDYLSRMARSD